MIRPVGTPGARGPFPAAEHRNGVKFPGEPVAVMVKERFHCVTGLLPGKTKRSA